MAQTPTTELEAVNKLLRAIGESPVSSLSGEVGVDVVNARATIAEVLNEVLAEGWQFNTEHEYPLMPDSITGEINVPGNASTVDIKKDRFNGTDPVQRGLRIYDRLNHTYAFANTLYARLVLLLPFDECPQTCRQYVTVRAARRFTDDAVGATDLHRYNKEDEMRARVVFVDDQSEDEDLNYIRDDPELGKIWRL